MIKKVCIIGGHVTPAVALIDELKQRNLLVDIVFIGRRNAMEGDSAVSYENQLMQKKQIPFFGITTGRLQRYFSWSSLRSLAKIPLGFWQSWHLIRKVKPDGIISFGGYVAVPVCICAKVSGIKVLTHEQTTMPGLANKIIANFADRICVSWPDTSHYFKKEKTVITGIPLRREFLLNDQQKVVHTQKPLLFVSGGSLGSHKINRTIADILVPLLDKCTVVHQCGNSNLTHDYAFLSRLRNNLSPIQKQKYLIKEHFSATEIVWLFRHATLVVARSGANTVAEVAFCGTPSLFIPLAIAGGGEQLSNALMLQKIGLSEILLEKDMNPESLFKLLSHMIQQYNTYASNAEKAQKLVTPDAVSKLADQVETLFNLSRIKST